MANLYINDTPGVTRVAPPVRAHYTQAGGQTLTANVSTLNYDVKVVDTDNAVTTGASSWKFTCPVGKGGTYIVQWAVYLNNTVGVQLYKNGIVQTYVGSPVGGAVSCETFSVDLVAGDYIDLRTPATGAGTQAVSTGGNWIQITRVPDTNVSAGQAVATAGASYSSNTNQALVNGTIVNLDVKDFDTDNAVTTGASWKFTVPAGKGGVYQIQGLLYTTAGCLFALYKNGSQAKYLTTATGASSTPGAISTVIALVPGDYIDIRATASVSLTGGSALNYLSIMKVPDQSTPPVIQGYTPVIARYSASAGQAVTADVTPINFDTKEIDSDNAVTTGASWKFTCPVGKGGSYLIQTANYYSAGGLGMKVWKNGSSFKFIAANTTATPLNGSVTIDLLPGDYIEIRSTNSVTTTTLAGAIWIMIQSLSTFIDSRADTGWIAATLTNSWQNYVGYQVKYRKINGIVYVQGVLNVAAGQGASNTSAFTLPAGFRPAQSTNKANVASVYYLTSANYQPDGTVPINFQNVLALYADVSHMFPADG